MNENAFFSLSLSLFSLLSSLCIKVNHIYRKNVLPRLYIFFDFFLFHFSFVAH